MSQPITPFNGTTVDPLLPSMQQQHLTQAQLDDLFGSNKSGQHLLSSNSEALNNLEFTYFNDSYAHIESSNPSTISTPDLLAYSFDQTSPTYSTPGQNSPHAYPIEYQQNYQSNAGPKVPTYDQRPLPTRWPTTSTSLRPAQLPQTYVRRRSLSHGDADRIAPVPPNPTFVRLQAPRTSSTTPEDTKRADPYPKHDRSASQGPGPRGRAAKPTSIPYILSGSPLVNGMMQTPIGTPLDMVREPASPVRLHCQYEPSRGLPIRHSNPVFEHMTHPNALARSRQVIQVGAMAVLNRSNVDPRLIQESGTNDKARILKKLQDVEQYIQGENRDENVLKACTVIRAALGQKVENKDVKYAEEGEDHLEPPSKVLSSEACGFYGGAGEDTDLMVMLMKEDANRVDDSGVDDL